MVPPAARGDWITGDVDAPLHDRRLPLIQRAIAPAAFSAAPPPLPPAEPGTPFCISAMPKSKRNKVGAHRAARRLRSLRLGPPR
jgi:hypothetical protein